MAQEFIKIRGAKEHNLKNVDVDIPKNKLVIFTGVSGSGKSSLAMDTIYAEGQRRYVESLSSYARQFLGVMGKPDVEYIEGLSPAIAIDQKTTSKNPRSTVGTVTEIYDYLRVLFARIGRVVDPTTGEEIKRQSPQEITEAIIQKIKQDPQIKTKPVRALIMSPIVRGRKGEYSKLFENLVKQGFVRARIDNKIYNLNKELYLIKTNKHDIDAIIDRVIVGKTTLQNPDKLKEFRSRLFNSVERALMLSEGLVFYSKVLDKTPDFPDAPSKLKDTLFSENFSFKDKSIEFPEVEPRIFSFNTPFGACERCNGIGTILEFNVNYMYNGELSVMQGGIFPLGNIAEKNNWTRRKIESFAAKAGISLNKPINELSKEQFDKLFYGDSSTKLTAQGRTYDGRNYSYEFRWEGVLKNLERRYKETNSDFIKNELEKYMIKRTCPTCNGTRLKATTLYVKVDKLDIAQVSEMPIRDSFDWINNLEKGNKLSKREKEIGKSVIKEIKTRLNFLVNVGLDYLSLARSSSTLAGGEAQRIRLASQIGSGLSGVLYVLDEPSIGLHAVDNDRLITTLKNLKELGNTVLVVEHDGQTMLESDYIIDFGPGAGILGGKVVAAGTPDELVKNKASITGKYLSGKKKVDYLDYMLEEEIENLRVNKHKGKFLEVIGASGHNLKNIDVKIPLGKLVLVTGVSGSGKSTLVNETILKGVKQELKLKNDEDPQPFSLIKGVEHIDKIIDIDQSPIGKTPRSNPATYTKAFDEIRKIFAQTKDARIKGYNPGRFSFNVKGGRCEACRGDGEIKIEMQFMPDVYVKCEVCGGKRYTSEVLEIEYKGKNISEVLDMSVDEALGFFNSNQGLYRKLSTLSEVGLGYIKLGQPAPTLSGGEAQRVKLASELSKMKRGHTLYILDEPTTGLHFADLERLIAILKKLVAKGNTVIVIEHNLDVIRAADHIIDLGPAGGDKGGEIVAQGSVSDIKNNKDSKTGLALRELYYL